MISQAESDICITDAFQQGDQDHTGNSAEIISPSAQHARWNYGNLKTRRAADGRANKSSHGVSARSFFNDPQFSPRTAQGALRLRNTLVED